MFTVVRTVMKNPSTFYEKVFLKRKQTYKIEKIRINSSHYYQLNIQTFNEKNRSTNWKKVVRSVNISDTPIIPPFGEKIPPELNLTRFDSSKFRLFILAGTMAKCVGKKAKIGIIDESGIFAPYIGRTVSLCREVIVVTANPEVYDIPNEECEKRFGASAVITDSLSSLENASALLVADAGKFNIPVAPMIFGKDYLDFDDCDIVLPKFALKLIPRNISPLDFAAALYELCKIDEMKNILPIIVQNVKSGQTIKVKLTKK